jgi:CubicO group peptidase (beta-lactamase class C family)
MTMRLTTLVLTALLLALFVCAGCAEQREEVATASGAAPVWPGRDWPRSTSEAAGIDAAVLEALDAEIRAGDHGNVHSMLVIRDGKIVFDRQYQRDYTRKNADLITAAPGPYNYYDTNWHPYYQRTALHTLQSVTKSIASLLVGIAIERGEVSGTDATLGHLLPDRELDDPRKADITLEQILTMQPGFEWDESSSYFDPENDSTRMESTSDWGGYLLAKPLAAEPGTVWVYNSANSHLLSEILTKATGQRLDQYAEAHLFGPLGIEDYYWKTAPDGYSDVSAGLFLRPHDLAKIALLCSRMGAWEGTQVVPREWIERSVQPHVRDVAPDHPEFDVGYGYQWWIYDDGRDGKPVVYGGWGWGGQFPLVAPELGLVAVFTGWNIYEDEEYGYAYELFRDRIVPAVASR